MANTQSKAEQSQQPPSLLSSLFTSKDSEHFLFQLTWLVIRLTAGGLMIHNGLDKLADVPGFAAGVVSFIGLPYPIFFTYCAAYTEIIGAILLMLGLLTRVNAGALLGTMTVAIFFHIKGNGLDVTPLETASLYAVLYAFFLINGAGNWSLDALIAKRLNS